MPRGPESQATREKKALALAEAFLGRTLELPAESTEDLMMEAQSALHYYEVKGKGYVRETCRQCGLVFEYLYHYAGIKYCTLGCARRALREIGLEWDTSRTIEDRWGRFAPSVVSYKALDALREAAEAQAIQLLAEHPASLS